MQNNIAETKGQYGYMIGKQSAQGIASTNMKMFVHEGGTALNEMVGKITKSGGFGSRNGSLGTETTSRYADPEIELNLGAETSGLFLLGALGNVATSTVETGVYKHTLGVNESNVPAYFSIVEKSKAGTKQVIDAALKSMSLSMSGEEFLNVKANFLGKYPVNVADNPLLEEESSFTTGMVKVFVADDVAGLSLASAMQLDGFTLNMENNSVRKFTGGEQSFVRHQRIGFNGTFDRVLDDTFVDEWFKDNAKKAMRIEIEHPVVIEGTAVKPKISITFPNIQLSERKPGGGNADLVTENFTFQEANYDIETGKSIEVEIVNGIATY